MNALQQMVSQSQLGADYLRRTCPAFPKPHLVKRDGLWYCTRHVYQDEFMTMPGVNARQAWIACNLPFYVVERGNGAGHGWRAGMVPRCVTP